MIHSRTCTLATMRKFAAFEDIETYQNDFAYPTAIYFDREFRKANPYDKRICRYDYMHKVEKKPLRDIVTLKEGIWLMDESVLDTTIVETRPVIPLHIHTVKEAVNCQLIMLAKSKKLKDLCDVFSTAPNNTPVGIDFNDQDLSLTVAATYMDITYKVTDTNTYGTVSE